MTSLMQFYNLVHKSQLGVEIHTKYSNI